MPPGPGVLGVLVVANGATSRYPKVPKLRDERPRGRAAERRWSDGDGGVWPDILETRYPILHRIPQLPPGHGVLEVLTAAFEGQLWMPGPAGP